MYRIEKNRSSILVTLSEKCHVHYTVWIYRAALNGKLWKEIYYFNHLCLQLVVKLSTNLFLIVYIMLKPTSNISAIKKQTRVLPYFHACVSQGSC